MTFDIDSKYAIKLLNQTSESVVSTKLIQIGATEKLVIKDWKAKWKVNIEEKVKPLWKRDYDCKIAQIHQTSNNATCKNEDSHKQTCK